MRKNTFLYFFTCCFLMATNLLAQPPCTEYPSPVIQPSFEALCQDPRPKDPGNDNYAHEKEECLLVCENSPVTYETPATGNTITWEAFGDVSPTTGSGPSFTVTWGSPGGGLIQVTETTIDGCATTVNVCVKVVASPDADFTTIPADVGGTITICEGGEVHFQDQSSNDVITWVWDFGDGVQSNDQNPSHQYNTAGSYSATLTVYNDCGCSDTKDVKVVVDPSSAPVIACVSTVCLEEKATYSVTNGCPGATYIWTAVGGTITSQMDNQVSVTWDNPVNGQGFLTVEVLGCGNVCPIPTTVIVPVITPNIGISGPLEVCVGDLVEYSVPPQPSYLYHWFGTASPFFVSTPNDHSIDVHWTTAGTYEICVRLSSTEFDCIGHDIYCEIVTVKDPFSVQPEIQEICETGSTFFITFPSVVSDWEAIDVLGNITPLASGATTTTVGPIAPGFYEIRATDVSGAALYCNSTVSGYLTVQPVAPNLAPGDLTGEMTVCPGSSHNYSATPGNGYYLQWATNDPANVIIGTGNDVAISWLGSPPYEIIITQVPMQGPACPSETTFPINVLVPTIPTISGLSTVCVDGQSSYTASPTTDVTFMEWEVIPQNIGSVVSGQNTPTADIQFNNTPMTGAVIRFNYTICNIDYYEDFPVDVVAFPTITIAPIDACQNESGGTSMSASLSPIPPGASFSWDWDFGTSGTANTSGSPTSNVSYSFPTSGTELVTVTATITGGSCPATISATQLVNVKPAPVVNITAMQGNSICPPTNSTTLVASVQNSTGGGGGTYTYNWAGGPSSATYTVSTPGIYTLTVVDNVSLCETVSTYEVFNCPSNPATCTGVNFTSTQSDCNTFNFTGTLSGGWTFDGWNFGDGNTSNVFPNVSHTFDHSGFYFVTLTGSMGALKCSETQQVVVNFVPEFGTEYTCTNSSGGSTIDVHLIDQTDFLPGTGLSYLWTYPGGSSTSPSPIITGMSSGLVTLQVTDGSTTCSVSHTITVPTPISAAFTSNAPACEGTPIAFTNTSTPSLADIATATWDFGDGSGSNLIPSAERTYNNISSNPIVNLMVTDIYGCVSDISQTITVHQNNLLGNVSITAPPNPACPVPPLYLTANFPGGTPSPTFQWNSTDLLINLGTTNPSGAVPTTGEYFVEITDGNGCVERSPNETVIIVPEPVAFIIGQGDYCEGETMNWSANQGSGYSYSWTVTTPPPSSITYNFSAPDVSLGAVYIGNYTLEVTLTDNLTGCSNTSPQFITTVHEGPQGLTIVNSGPNCVPANLTASVTSPSMVDYIWSTGDNGPSIVALGGGTVEVTAYTDQGCSASTTIDIGEGPDIADVAVGCYCFPNAVTWTAPQGAGYTYQWYMVSTPNDIPMGTNFQQNFTTSGVYYVVVTGPDGCSSTTDYIHIDIGGECDCRFEVDKLKLECVGKDPITGGFIYSFTSTVINYFAPLTGLNGVSNEGIITSISPTSIPGGGAATPISGTFVLLPGYSSATIFFQAAGANGLFCDFKLFVPKFPDCGVKDCDVEWYEPEIKCIFNYDGYSYYDFTISATNFGNTLTDIVWWPCTTPEVTITSSDNVLNGNQSTQLTGMIRVRDGITSDCFRVCGFDPITETICCWEIKMKFPECSGQEPCKDVKYEGGELFCANPNVDPFGNLVYDFDIKIDNHFPNGTAYLIPVFGEEENHVTNLNVAVSGTSYHLTGTVVDVPAFNDPLCFYVITYNGEEVCWTKFCIELPKCKAAARADGSERGSLNGDPSNIVFEIVPNPATSYINVSYEMAQEGFVELRMQSLNGQIVHSLSNLNTADNIHINTSDLTNGMYFLGIYKDGMLIEQRKVVVLKGN